MPATAKALRTAKTDLTAQPIGFRCIGGGDGTGAHAIMRRRAATAAMHRRERARTIDPRLLIAP
jgi:hypothetical protein